MPLFVPKDRKSLFRQFLAGMYDAVVEYCCKINKIMR